MEHAILQAITNRRPPSPPTRDDNHALPDDDVLSRRVGPSDGARTSLKIADTPPTDHESSAEPGGLNKDQNCKRVRPEEEERQRSASGVINMSSTLISRTVTPFLKEHIPNLYAP